jgi:outer membrane protein TolC
MSRKTLLAVAVTAWAIAATGVEAAQEIALPAPPASLSLSEALARAMRDSPEVRIAEAELMRAEAEAKNQALWPLRSVTANVSIVRQLNGAGSGLAPGQAPGAVGFGGPTAGAYLTMNVGELIGGMHMMRAASARVTTARENVRLVKLQVATGLTEAYAAWSAQKKLMALRQEAIKASQSDVVALERLFGRGGASLNDLLKARLAFSQSQVDLLTAEGDYNRAWTTLLQRMGDSGWLEAGAKGGPVVGGVELPPAALPSADH